MRRMRATVTQRAAQGTSVILSSHLLNLVEELCTKLLVLRQGRAVGYGTISEIIEAHPSLMSKSLEEVFLSLTATDLPAG
jgi:ABC-2 type transport system ATP-binding protein